MTAWHNHCANDVLAKLKVTHEGLASDEAAKRLAEGGANRLPAPPKPSTLRRFLRQFHNILIYVLLAAALITALLGHTLDTVVILAVVVLNSVIGFIQEGKAEKALDAIKSMLAPHAAVIRDGHRLSIAGEDLVVGDIVLLEAGDKVPADIRLLSAHGFSVQEAILTGESVPSEKNAATTDKADIPLGDRHNMAYSGTIVASGQAKGVVVAIGAATEIGRISGLLATVETLTTPLVRQMQDFAKTLTFFILGLATALVVYGITVQDYEFVDVFTAVVGLAVAAIPEGLPAVLTITLAIGVQAMAKRNAIVRRLPAIETVGSVSVICSDKTGTLTLNQMTVAKAIAFEGEHAFTVTGYHPRHGVVAQPPAWLHAMGQAAVRCNDAALTIKGDDVIVEGDPMEGALLAFAARVGAEAAGQPERLDAIPFDATHRYMAVLDADGVFVKGAPEKILSLCHNVDTSVWHAHIEALARDGMRVLALARMDAPTGSSSLSHAAIEGKLTFLGLVGLIDPPRPEAISSVEDCHNAGIAVKMITGDHAGTAAAIGLQIGLKNADKVLTGNDIDAMDDAALAVAVQEVNIFARTSPEHKLRLVMALQAQGAVVAMTGDGVNDAPALKRADAGIAMGKKGSEAAREASELVLADDNFASIAAAVREGRRVYDNLKKVILFLLPINGGESFSLIIALLLGVALPITAAQILWVNMVSSVALALSLAFEPAERGIMRRPPRPMNAPILSLFLIWRVVFVSMLFTAGIFGQFYLAKAEGYSLEMARTMAVNTLVVMEVFYLFSVRYTHGTSLSWQGVKGTPAVLMAVAVVALLQWLFTYAPFMNVLFGVEPLNLFQSAQVLAFGVIILLLLEIEKYITALGQKNRRCYVRVI